MAETPIEWTITHVPDGRKCPLCRGTGQRKEKTMPPAILKFHDVKCYNCNGTGTVYVLPGYTFNTHWGCVEQGAECDNCYARAFSHRMGFDLWGKDADRRFFGDKYWNQLTRWNEYAKSENVKLKVFTNSMSDLFERRADLIPHRNRLIDSVYQNENLIFLMLTKLPHNIQKMVPSTWNIQAPPNVWYGTSIGVNKSKWRLKHLTANPAAVHFVSGEPLLERLTDFNLNNIQWFITGGESGGKKRPFSVEAARALRDQCREEDVPFFMKQIDKVQPIPEDLMIRQFPKLIAA